MTRNYTNNLRQGQSINPGHLSAQDSHSNTGWEYGHMLSMTVEQGYSFLEHFLLWSLLRLQHNSRPFNLFSFQIDWKILLHENLARKARINTFTNSIRNQFIFLFQMSMSTVSQVKEHMCQEIKLFLQNSL